MGFGQAMLPENIKEYYMGTNARALTCNFIQALTRAIDGAMYAVDYQPENMEIRFDGCMISVTVDEVHIAYDTRRAEIRPIYGELQLQLTREAILQDTHYRYGYEPNAVL